jgi:hypothetical protein
MKFLFVMYWLVLLTSCNKDEEPKGANQEETVEDFEFAVDIGDSKIPYIVINTGDASINNEPKVPARMVVFENGEITERLHIGIEFRGSTSFRISDKKSFGFESWDEDGGDIDVELLGFPEEEDWILNGHVVNLQNQFIFDRTLMYHHLGYDLYRQTNRYASRTKFVELEVNGEYLGVYVFMEKIKRDKNRLDINKMEGTDVDVTGGYVLKIDKTTGGVENAGQPLEYFLNNWADDARYNVINSWRSQFDVFGNPMLIPPYGEPYHPEMYLETYFLYEYPSSEDITTDQKEYIQQYMDSFEAALIADDLESGQRTYAEYIDINSFIDHMLITELVRNVDAYRLSTFLYKDRGGKLSMGPVWDLNIGFDSGDRIPWHGWVYQYNTYVEQDAWMVHFWWPRLMQDPVFTAALKTRWQALRSGPLSNSNVIGKVGETANYLKVNGAVSRNYEVWDAGIGVDYNASVASLREFLEYRLSWMDEQIAAF